MWKINKITAQKKRTIRICVKYSQWFLSRKDLKKILYILDICHNDMLDFSVGEKEPEFKKIKNKDWSQVTKKKKKQNHLPETKI